MKKRIIIPAILSAVLATGLTSCVKDNESDSVKNLRDAKAEELRGNAEAQKAAAAVKLAEAKYKEAQVAYAVAEAKEKEHVAEVGRILAETAGLELAKQKATHQLEIDAEVASATAALEDAKLKALTKIEKAQKEKAEAEKEKAQAIVAMLKVQQALAVEKATAYEAAVASYTNAELDVIAKQNAVDKQKNTIEAVKVGTASATRLLDLDKQEKEQEIARLKLANETLEGAQKYTVAELQAKINEENAKYLAANIKYQDEKASDKLKNLQEEAQKLKKNYSVEFVDTDFYKVFEEMYNFEMKAFNSSSYGAGYYYFNLRYVRQIGGYTQTKTTLSNGDEVVYGVTSLYPSYEVVPEQVRDLKIIRDGYENDNVLNLQKRKDYEKAASVANSIAWHKKNMDDARTAWVNEKNKPNVDQTEVKNKWIIYEGYQSTFNEESKKYEKIVKQTDNHAKRMEIYDRAIALLESTEGIKNFNDAVAKYNEAVNAAAAQHFKQEELGILPTVHSNKKEEYDNILKSGYQDVKNQIETNKKKIETLQAEILELANIHTLSVQKAIADAEQKLANKVVELEAAKAKRDALKAALEALKP